MVEQTLGPGCLVVLFAALGLSGGSGAFASDGSLPDKTVLAEVNGERTFLFTQRYCKPGKCVDATPGARRTGTPDLPVLIASPGDTITFTVAFKPTVRSLTVRSSNFEQTIALDASTWQVPEGLPRPATVELTVNGDTESGTFLAVIDKTAPGPRLDRGHIGARVIGTPARRTFTARFRLCSQQTGEVVIDLAERRIAGTRHIRQALLRTHVPGCKVYRVRLRSPWPGVAPFRQVAVRVGVGRSQLGEPVRLLAPRQ